MYREPDLSGDLDEQDATGLVEPFILLAGLLWALLRRLVRR